VPRFDRVGDVLPIEIEEGDEENKVESFTDISSGDHWTSE